MFRAVFFSALTFFMVMSIHIFRDVEIEEVISEEMQSLTLLANEDHSTADNSEHSPHHQRNSTTDNSERSHRQRNLTHQLNPHNKTANDEESKTVLSFRSLNDYLRQEVALANEKQMIRNLDKFDLSFDESAIVIVVQVHNRSEYLRHLVESLNRSKDIGEALLIFSHDVYSIELNEIIEKIDFCLVFMHF